MAKQITNRIKYTLWHEEGSLEYDGSIAGGLYHAAQRLSPVERRILIDRLVEQQEASRLPAGYTPA